MQINGMRLRGEIARRQLTATEFAKKAGLSNFGLYRTLQGNRPTLKTLGKLAAALDIDDPTELLEKPQEEAQK